MLNLNISVNNRLHSDFELFIHKVFETVDPGTPLVSNWHIGLTAEYLKACIDRDIKRLIICQPPRTLKSTIFSIALPAWILGHHPSETIIASSCTQTLSEKLSVQCKLVMSMKWYKEVFPETRISPGEDTKSKFTTTKRGERYATSTEGTVIGFGGNFLITDDPHKAADVHSDTMRQKTIDWYNTAWCSRLNNPTEGVMILNMQRLHENDLAGYLIEKGGYELLKIPMQAERDIKFFFPSTTQSKEIYKFMKEGELLMPTRYDEKYIADKKKDINTWATQYQQNPAPMEGGIFKQEYMQYYDKLPEINRIVQSWDMAFKKGKENDYSVCSTWGILDGEFAPNFYLIDIWRGKLLYPELKKQFIELQNRYSPYQILIEDAASAQSLIPDLQAAGNNVLKPIKTGGIDKFARAQAPSNMFANGRIFLPKNAPWLSNFLNELCIFPNSTHDDQVDSITQFLNWANVPYRKFRAAWC